MRDGVVVSLTVILVSSILVVNPNFVFAQNNPPQVDYIKANENTEFHTTYYQLFFTDPTHPDPDGDLITITWSISNSCGNFFYNANYATWEHPVSSCGNDPVQAVITATANDGHGNAVIRTYDKGSVTGTGSSQGPTNPNGTSSNPSGSVSNPSSANSGQSTGLQTTTTTSQNTTNGTTHGPNIVVIGLVANPKLAKIGEPVTFIVRVINMGDEDGSRKLTATVFGKLESDPLVYVDGTTPIIPANKLPVDVTVLKFTSQNEDTFTVKLEGLSDTFRVTGIGSLKQMADLWSAGTMSTNEFGQGMLRSMGPTHTGWEYHIPNWMKKDAFYYGHGMMSDDDFLKMEEYLIEKGVISIHPKSTP